MTLVTEASQMTWSLMRLEADSYWTGTEVLTT
jgi:hypothetical protein